MRPTSPDALRRPPFARVAARSLLAAAGGFWLALVLSAGASDWPQYRGPNHDGTSPDRINTQWDGSVTNAVWRVDFGAAAYSSVVVSQGEAVTQVYSNGQETCIALGTTNGAQLWATSLETGNYNYSYPGPRSTPTISQGSVYVLTSNVKLFRLNFTNGTVIWSNNLVATLGATVINYNSAASPLLDGGLLYVNLGTGNNALAAFWATNGALAWQVQPEQMTHSTPVAATINGVRQVIFATQIGLVSLDASSGNKLWGLPYPFPGYNGTCLGGSPMVYSNLVFISESYYPTFSILARVDFTNGAWSATQLWNQPVGMIWMTPVYSQGAIYGPTGDNSSSTTPLVCLDLLTGTQLWSYQGFGRGSVTLVDNNLILGLDEAGTLHLISPNTNAYTELASFTAFASRSCWNSPAIADGKLYARSTTEAACFDLSMPDLKLDRPQVVARGMLQLTVRAANGAAVNPDRLAAMQVLATTNPAVSAAEWSELTNSLVLTNGTVQIDDVDVPGLNPWFFMVSEPR